MVSGWRNKCGADPPVVEGVREKGDETKQRPCHESAQDPDADREQRNRHHSRSCGEIAEVLRTLFVMFTHDAIFPLESRRMEFSAYASSGPERSSSVRCASASLRRAARPAGVRRTHTSRLSSGPGCLAIAPVCSLSLIHISEPTSLGMISYAVFCLKK